MIGDPGLAHAFENARFFILVADVRRRVAPIGTSTEWLLLFASHQNVIKFERDARPRLTSKPSHQHSNNPCGHCGHRCPKCAADRRYAAVNVSYEYEEARILEGIGKGRGP